MNKLRELGLLDKRFLLPAIAVIIILGVLGYATIVSVTSSESERDLNKASKQLEKSSKETAKKVEKELKKSEDDLNFNLDDFEISTMEQVKKFVNTLSIQDNTYAEVDDEFGEGTYELYTEKMLPSSSDDELTTLIKVGQIKSQMALSKNAKGNFILPIFNPVNPDDSYTLSLNTYATRGGGFSDYNSNFRIGYVEADFEGNPITSTFESKDGVDNFFKVTFIAYSKKDMTAKEFQDEMDKIPVSVGGNILEPEYRYWINYDSTKLGVKDKDYKNALANIYSSLKGVTSLTNATDWKGKDINKTKIYGGVPIKVSYVGSVSDYFSKNNARFDEASYRFINIPDTITVNIGSKFKASLSKEDSKELIRSVPASK